MELALVVWLVMTALPAIKGMGAALAFGTLIFGVVAGLAWVLEQHKASFMWWRKRLWVAVPFIVFAALLPSEKTSWYMVGAFGTQKLVESPVAQELASDGVDVLKSLMARAKTEIEGAAKK